MIEHVNSARALSYVVTSPTEGMPLHHDRFPEVAHHAPGTLLEIGQAGGAGPVLDWRVAEGETLPGLCERRSGELTRQEGQAFAFIRAQPGDVFVPPDLAKDFPSGRPVNASCLAVRRANKKGRVGWRVVRFIPA